MDKKDFSGAMMARTRKGLFPSYFQQKKDSTPLSHTSQRQKRRQEYYTTPINH